MKKKRTLKGLAKSIGISNQWIHAIRTGRGQPSWDIALKLADATATNPELWMSKNPKIISRALQKYLNTPPSCTLYSPEEHPKNKKELAYKLNISPSYLYTILAGRCTPSTRLAHEMAQIMGTSQHVWLKNDTHAEKILAVTNYLLKGAHPHEANQDPQ